jgi:uncharacterized membrane protein YczE
MQKKFVNDLAAVTLATAMIGAATCCYVRAGLGGDSVAVFFDGLSATAGISLGTASWLFNLALLATAFLIARNNLGWTTIYNSLLAGGFVDLADWALGPLLELDGGLIFRWVLFLAGLMLLTGACALMMRRCPGMSVLDAITASLARKLKLSYRLVRITIDVLLMGAGWLMSGVVGLGTLAAVLATGPPIQFFYQIGTKK